MQAILDAFNSFFGIIGDFFTSLFQFVKYIGVGAGLAYNLVASLPTWLQAFGSATILISILYLILGRQTGGNKNG